MKLGSHVLVEYHNCHREFLDDLEGVEKLMVEAVDISGATLVQPLFHQFSPYGVSGVCVVAESHFAIHTWPEHGYAAVDLFSCGEFDYRTAMEHIASGLKSDSWKASLVERGIIGQDGQTGELTIASLDTAHTLE
jgi:S-adenosylmethionine decarboxylase proenzyme